MRILFLILLLLHPPFSGRAEDIDQKGQISKTLTLLQQYLTGLGEFDIKYKTTRELHAGPFFPKNEKVTIEHRLVFGDKGYHYWETATSQESQMQAINESSYYNGKFYRLDPRKCFTFGSVSNRFCERLASTGPLFYPLVFIFNFRDPIDLRIIKDPEAWLAAAKAATVSKDGNIQVKCRQIESQIDQTYDITLDERGIPDGWRMTMPDMVGDCKILDYEKVSVNGQVLQIPKKIARPCV